MNQSYQYSLYQWLQLHQQDFSQIVDFDPVTEKLLALDFTDENKLLTSNVLEDIDSFSAHITAQLQLAGAKFGYGGYAEHRNVYSRSTHFDDPYGGEPRRLHLGIDIWAPEGTTIYAPVSGIVHSFAFNDNQGDYGATIILSHQLDGRQFYTLYGHLSLADLQQVREGNYVVAGQELAHIGPPSENGHWPPHLHFQVIEHLGITEGDYPGVCRLSEKELYLANCPDPDVILQMRQFAQP